MDRYIELIKNMPVDEHSFTTRKSTWAKFIQNGKPASRILSEMFSEKNEIELSRADLFALAKQNDYQRLAIATILWGYPAGMRGNHFENISNKLVLLEEILKEAVLGIEDWDAHYSKTKSIRGLGLSTYTKFLYFCGAKVKTLPCVILDQRIIDVVNKGVLSGLGSLHGVRTSNASKKYCDYLKIIDEASKKYGASHGGVEMFIFAFGLNIKPAPNRSLLALTSRG
ncbi:hypothetical protein [Flavobacterium sp.]|uniref:8-oxoguanine DNA glycosylase OGG fold protein n=1 Tax=Flavobacterium sp. TaxID=239 RepID=UPI002635CEA1|nr:hypothetical protein [Flavobacterium sp.]